MTITLVNFLGKVNNLIGDNISGTTDANGTTDKTTFVDSTLATYDDRYFGDPERNPQWWAYIGTDLRQIKSSQGETGTVTVFKAFATQVMSSIAYQIHRFDRNKKIIACNEALTYSYPYFYKRVEDATTLDGKGASDTEYTVPTTFTEFPDEIYEKHVSGTSIYYIPIVDYQVVEIGGTMKFYASISTGYDILLVGKKPLTPFTNDASTTELTDAQAEVVALLAASMFYRNISGVVNAEDSGRYDSLTERYEAMYEERKLRHCMPLIAPRRFKMTDSTTYAPGW